MDSIWIPCGMWGESKDLLFLLIYILYSNMFGFIIARLNVAMSHRLYTSSSDVG